MNKITELAKKAAAVKLAFIQTDPTAGDSPAQRKFNTMAGPLLVKSRSRFNQSKKDPSNFRYYADRIAPEFRPPMDVNAFNQMMQMGNSAEDPRFAKLMQQYARIAKKHPYPADFIPDLSPTNYTPETQQPVASEAVQSNPIQNIAALAKTRVQNPDFSFDGADPITATQSNPIQNIAALAKTRVQNPDFSFDGAAPVGFSAKPPVWNKQDTVGTIPNKQDIARINTNPTTATQSNPIQNIAALAKTRVQNPDFSFDGSNPVIPQQTTAAPPKQPPVPPKPVVPPTPSSSGVAAARQKPVNPNMVSPLKTRGTTSWGAQLFQPPKDLAAIAGSNKPMTTAQIQFNRHKERMANNPIYANRINTQRANRATQLSNRKPIPTMKGST